MLLLVTIQRLFYAVDRRAPFVYRSHNTQTVVAVQDLVRFQAAVAIQLYPPPLTGKFVWCFTSVE